jgi:hypothetical protein
MSSDFGAKLENFHEKLHHAIQHLGRNQLKSKKRNASSADYGQDVPVFTLLIFLIGLIFTVLAVLLFRGMETTSQLLVTILPSLFVVFGLIGMAAGIFLI